MSDSSKRLAELSPEEKRILLAQLLHQKAVGARFIAPTPSSRCNTLIESLGVYLPEQAVSTEQVLRNCNKQVLFPLEEFTGIKSRRVAGEGEFSIDLAKKAIQVCLARSKYLPEDIDILICANCSRYDGPDQQFSFEPGTAIQLKKYFGFEHALVFDITNACAGMFTAIYIIDALIKARLIGCGMVASGEYITHLTRTAQQEIEDYMDPRLACLTLGDAGAALILEEAPSNKVGFGCIELYTLGKHSDLCIAGPTDQPHGGAIMRTEMAGLTAVGVKHSVAHAQHMLTQQQRPLETFQHIIPHQTSRLSINEVAREVNRQYQREVCDESKMICNLAERGNTASTSHFVALSDAIFNNSIQAGESIIFSITASGLTVGTALYTLDDLPDRLRHHRSPIHHAPDTAQPISESPRGARFIAPTADLSATDEANTTHSGPQSPRRGRFIAPTADLSAIVPTDAHVPPARTPRVRIESVGTISDAQNVPRNTRDLAAAAIENCLSKSSLSRNAIELLIHAGTYRTDFIAEPAVAATVVGSAGINDDIASPSDQKTFAFDVVNGGLGCLNACYIAVGMLRAKQVKNAMIVASEIENNAGLLPQELRGLKETGSALILELAEAATGEAGTCAQAGFGNFVFKDFPSYIDAFTVQTYQERGKTFTRFKHDPHIEDYYVKCINETVAEVLAIEQLAMSQINVIFPPQISSTFISRLSDAMCVSRGKFIDIACDEMDLFTSSLAYALQHAYEQKPVKSVKAGDIGLIINVGTGIQVGCAIYYF